MNLRGEAIAILREQGPLPVFDVVPRADDDHWSHIGARLAKGPEALAGCRSTLEAGIESGRVAARRPAQATTYKLGERA